MSEREEYTPPMEVLHDIYCGIFEPINQDDFYLFGDVIGQGIDILFVAQR